ncbi:cytochrome C [Pseudoxanthomonas kalamensis DSM 18571]|uniref:c-type cytochrome n=1 Tax=Pseudoxanthomonas kalamensis TaxID=289483 RepID=UPI001391D743|nr:c-type cytochrome [Pseudoxanthomonas kalamensis]KAF1710622.1 cytochrome C [Pseudoxanthomonas kalamensis DSM 18571]
MSRIRFSLGFVVALAVNAAVFAQSTASDETATAGALPDEASAAVTHDWYDLRHRGAPPGDIEAGRRKAELCATCHGPTGAVSVAPMIPTLAGQSASYLYWELMEYKRGTLPDSPMTVLTAEVSEEDIRDLASFYATQKPEAQPHDDSVPSPDPTLLARGEALYLHGDPDKGIPPCQGCHGSDARGHALADQTDRSGNTPYAIYPALRSQHVVYLQSRLDAFHEGKMHYSSNDAVMTSVGQRLDAESIQALSTWLSSLPP